MADSNRALKTTNLPDGTVKITPHHDPDWLLVEIGRARYVKRFNLHVSEAQQLLDQLSDITRKERAS